MAYSTIKFISNSIKTDVYFIQSFSHHQFIEALDSLNGSLRAIAIKTGKLLSLFEQE
jgi:hypothetical protein